MSKLNRREFIERAAVVGAAGVVVFACNKGGGGGAAAGGGGGGLTCTDVSGLAPADAQLRTTVAYVDQSPEAGKTCSNCSLFTAPAAEGECGGCTAVKGPIHPDGYCTLWVAA